MSGFDAIADEAVRTVQRTFGESVTWMPSTGVFHPLTALIDTEPDPIGDLGPRFELRTTAAVRIAELQSVAPGARLAVGDEVEWRGRVWRVDAVLDDDGVEQTVALR